MSAYHSNNNNISFNISQLHHLAVALLVIFSPITSLHSYLRYQLHQKYFGAEQPLQFETHVISSNHLFIFVDSYTKNWRWNQTRLKLTSCLHLICDGSYTKIILALNNLTNLIYFISLNHFIHTRWQLHQKLALKPITTETYFLLTPYLQWQLHQFILALNNHPNTECTLFPCTTLFIIVDSYTKNLRWIPTRRKYISLCTLLFYYYKLSILIQCKKLIFTPIFNLVSSFSLRIYFWIISINYTAFFANKSSILQQLFFHSKQSL
jgi:hypothetical protein